MKIDNCNVYELAESIAASGLPMLAEYDAGTFTETAGCIRGGLPSAQPHLDRACRLAAMPDGSGHRTFLSGILVSANVTATNVWYMQFERYHFAQIVSSQSKMHRIRQMMAAGCNGRTIAHPKTGLPLADIHADMDDIEKMVYNCPMGLELTARITTNYLQLRTIWKQRRNHKLQEWRDFCKWIETLPMAGRLIVDNRSIDNA